MLEFECRIATGGNSGSKYLAKPSPPNCKRYYGCEFQLLDDTNYRNGWNKLTSAGALYALFAPGSDAKRLKPIDEFNESKVVVDGNRLEHWLNGAKIVDVAIGSDSWKESGPTAGPQIRGLVRKIQIKPLASETPNGER